MLDLARVAKLHDAAIAAGLPGVLPEGYTIDRLTIYSTPLVLYDDKNTRIPNETAQAAVAWWLREWCKKLSYRMTETSGDEDYLAWVEEVVEYRNRNRLVRCGRAGD